MCLLNCLLFKTSYGSVCKAASTAATHSAHTGLSHLSSDCCPTGGTRRKCNKPPPSTAVVDALKCPWWPLVNPGHLFLLSAVADRVEEGGELSGTTNYGRLEVTWQELGSEGCREKMMLLVLLLVSTRWTQGQLIGSRGVVVLPEGQLYRDHGTREASRWGQAAGYPASGISCFS